MGDSAANDLFKAHTSARDKYDYFLLAASGAAIAFALTQTKDAALSWSHAPLGLAILCWSLSFYVGCRHLDRLMQQFHSNYGYVKYRQDVAALGPTSKEYVDKITQNARDDIENFATKALQLGQWQFKFFVWGSIFYIGWHVYAMYQRIPLPHHG